MTYDTVATVGQVVSLLIFVGLFAGVVVYALWPANGPRFEAAQRRALDLDDKHKAKRGQS
ncbi:MAG TPA: cbb3-type cytochrome c oxidase subunit 3 [Hyphomicrobiaceae bacterium]|nr:cbb3-type cytochrome c oxidase subunit 3 [Hyphomicrobiaceae bacterium]